MQIEVESNTLQVLEDLERAAIAMPQALEAAVSDVAVATLLSTTAAMERLIYDQPLPESYRKYGLSDRTGALLAGEALVINSPTEQVITTENTGLAGKDPTLYAEWRHDYFALPAPWREEGLADVEDDIPHIAAAAVQRVVGEVMTP